MKTWVIAEAGVNHNGQEDLALKLVDEAVAAGADVVKFQTFKAKNLVTDTAEQADYQVQNTGKSETQLSMLSRLELSFSAHHRLVEYCKQKDIVFLSTAFDSESLNFLVNELGLSTLKIPSGEITNAPFLLEHARTGCDLIVSTGMCDLSDIESALGVLAFGLTESASAEPSETAFRLAYASTVGQRALQEKVRLLHCTTEYPTTMKEVNLRVLNTFKSAFGLPVGYSDHTEGVAVATAAVALGAMIIEKHFTLDKSMEGPDHKASLEPAELRQMVTNIREVEVALGSPIKHPTDTEFMNRRVVRKSLVAAKRIQRGEAFSSSNLAIKRPGTGLAPIHYWDLLSTAAKRAYAAGDLIVD